MRVPLLLGILLGLSLTQWVLANEACNLSLSDLTPGRSQLNKFKKNKKTADLGGAYFFNFEEGNEPIDPPRAASLVRQIKNLILNPLEVHPEKIEVKLVRSLSDQVPRAETVGQNIERRVGSEFILDLDSSTKRAQIFLTSVGLSDLDANKLNAYVTRMQIVANARLHPEKIAPLLSQDKSKLGIHVGGLVSISAEPPEGFFAAATEAEMSVFGWKSQSADQASVWIYRTPDARNESYFKFQFATKKRPADSDRSSKFKIVTGLGPEISPFSRGSKEASLVWFGDEQGGALSQYLETISNPELTLDDLMNQKGLIQKISDKKIVVANIDETHSLSQEGFNDLVTDPKIFREVYSEDYDAYLANLFKYSHDESAKKTYLLATSRGCSQGCAICCSGGMTQFQYFKPDHMIRELEKIAADSGSNSAKINIFFVDSNFNNNPGRLIEFAQLLNNHSIKNRFNFYCRHNTLNGFLKAGGNEGLKSANSELIASYKNLGFKEIFMGVDGFDDASVFTLKTHKFKVMKEGGNLKPIYNSREISSVIGEINSQEMYSKAFFLTNNPWVSDYDRVDSYFNLLDLWLRFDRFSIDSARDRNVLRLKPFDGSPITEAAQAMGADNFIRDGRFYTTGPLGELDEKMEFGQFGVPNRHSDVKKALDEFWVGLSRIIRDADRAAASQVDAEYSKNILSKINSRIDEVVEYLRQSSDSRIQVASKEFLKNLKKFQTAHLGLEKFDSKIQQIEFERRLTSLQRGLQKTQEK